MDTSLVEVCQQHLIAALRERITQTEVAIGNRFGFEIVQRGDTTAFLAHQWPHAPERIAFHRVFNYTPPPESQHDTLLERLVDEHIDAVIEVMPGIQAEASAAMLRAYHFVPAWVIPWYHIPVQSFQYEPLHHAVVRPAQRSEFSRLIDILIAGYGYTGNEADAWHAFAHAGYAAPTFTPFIALIEDHIAAVGMLHMKQSTALVDGVATLPAYRGRGLQKALLAARIRQAKEQGALYAFSRTGAGSVSELNLQKIGMQLLTQSTAWRRSASTV
jgi:GNAT superfamily N-acetyltransferase